MVALANSSVLGWDREDMKGSGTSNAEKSGAWILRRSLVPSHVPDTMQVAAIQF